MKHKNILIILFLTSLLILPTGCWEGEWDIGELILAAAEGAAIRNKAREKGEGKCPYDQPYKVADYAFGYGGVCLGEEDMKTYIALSLANDDEGLKEFVGEQKALIRGKAEGCPKNKPYWKAKYIGLIGGGCVSQAGLYGGEEPIKPGEYGEYNPELTTKCESPYTYSESQGKCILPPNTCVFDKDCGTPRCSGTTKEVPRCDLRTNKCAGTEKTDCKEYGTDYTCTNGECTRQRASYIK